MNAGADDQQEPAVQAGKKNGASASAGRPLTGARTVRILDLMRTKVQCVRIELVGGEDSIVDRLGTWLLFMPFLLIGYVLLLAAAVNALHAVLGWGPSLFLFGASHMAVGTWGVTRARSVGLVTREAVLDPRVATGSSAARAAQDGELALRLRKTPLPLPFREPESRLGTGGPDPMKRQAPRPVGSVPQSRP